MYITGRRKEALEKAAKAHSPDQTGQIIPYVRRWGFRHGMAYIGTDTMDRIGPCDVTSKDDLEKLYQDLSKRETHLDLLGTHDAHRTVLWLARL